MKLTLPPPPQMTGNTAMDTAALRDWCFQLHSQLRRVLMSLDGENIASLPYDRIIDIPNDTGGSDV